MRHAVTMRSRTGGMWWGTAIEAPDPGALARFYADLLGWHLGHEEPGTAVVASSPQGPFFVFQQADGYQAPAWPPADGAQRPMMHFDFQVGDLEIRGRRGGGARRHRGGLPAATERPDALRPGRPPLLPLPRRGLTTRTGRDRRGPLARPAHQAEADASLRSRTSRSRTSRSRDAPLLGVSLLEVSIPDASLPDALLAQRPPRRKRARRPRCSKPSLR